MKNRRHSTPRGVLLTLGCLLLVASTWLLPASAEEAAVTDDPAAQTPTVIDVIPDVPRPTPVAEIAAIWNRADGSILDGSEVRPFLFGAEPLAVVTEHYQDSATGLRQMTYFEKGRLDILDPSEDPANPWFVSPAALVREMLSGSVEYGENERSERGLAPIPIVGDLNQPNAVTYATLGMLTDLEIPLTAPLRPEGLAEMEMQAPNLSRVGDALTALLSASGAFEPDGALPVDGAAPVVVGEYDAVTQRNIATPFVAWRDAQGFVENYLLGHPLTEPYWVDTLVDGVPKRLLVQAFERRVLVYDPAQPEGTQVDSTDVGIHYRLWRNLAQPVDGALSQLAAAVPFGEEIVSAATAHLIDPHLMAALALVASNGDPQATLANGGRGILGLRPDAAIALGVPAEEPIPAGLDAPALATAEVVTLDPTLDDANATVTTSEAGATNGGGGGSGIVISPRWVEDVMRDPAHNAAYAARDLTQWNPLSLDFASIAADYYSNGAPNWDDPALQEFVTKVVAARDDLLARFPLPVRVTAGSIEGQHLGTGHSAYYDPSYDRAWWERTLLLYQSWNKVADNWQNDPNGFYCVRPGYIPGQRLQLVANGVTIICTIGDTVAEPHLSSWLAHWVIEMNYPAFEALGLDRNNMVEVFHIESDPPPPVPTPPAEETPTPSATPTTPPTEPTSPAEPTATPTMTPTPPPAEPTPPVAPTATPTTPPVSTTAEPSLTSTPAAPGNGPVTTPAPGSTPTTEAHGNTD